MEKAEQLTAEKDTAVSPERRRRSMEVEEPGSPSTPVGRSPSRGDNGSMSPVVLSASPSYYDDFGGDFIIYNRMPMKEICLAIALLAFGVLGIVLGSYMAYYKVWGDRSHGLIFAGLGAMLFIPGFHETRIAYFAWIGYKGFSFSNIPAV